MTILAIGFYLDRVWLTEIKLYPVCHYEQASLIQQKNADFSQLAPAVYEFKKPNIQNEKQSYAYGGKNQLEFRLRVLPTCRESENALHDFLFHS